MLLAAFAVLAAVAGPPPLPDAFDAALAACLHGGRWRLDAQHIEASAAEAPDLPAHSLIARVPTAEGRLYVYQDDARSRVVECGVAAYGEMVGVDVPALRQRIALGDGPTSPDAWRLTSRPGVRAIYWGTGVYGIMLLQAAPGQDGPTLQVDRHSVLVP